MITSTYAKAYTEVLEILNHLSEEEYSKIPKDKIEFYKNNMDKNYKYIINPAVSLTEQKISKEANAILIGLYKKYFASVEQNVKIDEILKQNQRKVELEKSMKYNSNNIFSKKEQANQERIKTEETQVVEKRESIFSKLKVFVLKIFGNEN